MSELRRILRETYDQHYLRRNPPDTGKIYLEGKRFLDLSYGSLLKKLPPPSPILDLGCGSGYLLMWMADHPNVVPVGVDSSPGQVELARRFLPGVDITCADGLDYLKTSTHRFAGIFCMDVIEHIPDEDALLDWIRSAKRALIPGGFFCCKTPNAANLLSPYSRYLDLTHARIFTQTSLLQLLEDAAGFKNCQVIPLRATTTLGSIRLWLERMMHRAIHRVTGSRRQEVFTPNIVMVGYNG